MIGTTAMTCLSVFHSCVWSNKQSIGGSDSSRFGGRFGCKRCTQRRSDSPWRSGLLGSSGCIEPRCSNPRRYGPLRRSDDRLCLPDNLSPSGLLCDSSDWRVTLEWLKSTNSGVYFEHQRRRAGRSSSVVCFGNLSPDGPSFHKYNRQPLENWNCCGSTVFCRDLGISYFLGNGIHRWNYEAMTWVWSEMGIRLRYVLCHYRRSSVCYLIINTIFKMTYFEKN